MCLPPRQSTAEADLMVPFQLVLYNAPLQFLYLTDWQFGTGVCFLFKHYQNGPLIMILFQAPVVLLYTGDT